MNLCKAICFLREHFLVEISISPCGCDVTDREHRVLLSPALTKKSQLGQSLTTTQWGCPKRQWPYLKGEYQDLISPSKLTVNKPTGTINYTCGAFSVYKFENNLTFQASQMWGLSRWHHTVTLQIKLSLNVLYTQSLCVVAVAHSKQSTP